jgi:site-specific recombinase XerD
MGRVYPRGKTLWISYYVNGVEKREPSGTNDERLATKLLNKRLGEVATGNFIEPSDRKLTIDEIYQLVIDDYRMNNMPSLHDTEARWQRQPKPGEPMPAPGRLKKEFAGMRALALTTERLNKYILKYQRTDKNPHGRSNATINRDLAALRRGYHLAEQGKLIQIQMIPHFPMLEESEPRQGFVEYEDYDKLAAHAKPLWLRTFLACAYLGMRCGELVGNWRIGFADGLQVRNIDLAAREIHTNKTKNKDRRTVPMTQEVYNLMVACCAGKSRNDWVFTWEKTGEQVKWFRATWDNLLRAAGVRDDILRHDNRRSAVRNMERAGVNRSTARGISGHKTESVYLRYDIVSQKDLREAVRKIDAAKAENAQFTHIPSELHQNRAPVDSRQPAPNPSDSINYN